MDHNRRLKTVSFLPLLYRLKPHTLSAILSLHGGSFEATEQQPVGKIDQVWRGQVTRLLLQEVMDNTLGATCRAAIHRPGEERHHERGTRPKYYHLFLFQVRA